MFLTLSTPSLNTCLPKPSWFQLISLRLLQNKWLWLKSSTLVLISAYPAHQQDPTVCHTASESQFSSSSHQHLLEPPSHSVYDSPGSVTFSLMALPSKSGEPLPPATVSSSPSKTQSRPHLILPEHRTRVCHRPLFIRGCPASKDCESSVRGGHVSSVCLEALVTKYLKTG